MPDATSGYSERDHSTVCCALKRVTTLREDEPQVDGLVTSVAGEIQSIARKEDVPRDANGRIAAGINYLHL